MLNPDLKLNTKLFDKDVESVSLRQGFGEGLVAAARENKNVVGLCADLAESTYMHLFAKEFPERFIEVGVAEQNLVTIASGLAAMGKIPFVSSYAMFSPGRNWEQIRTTICYNNRPVVIVGSHAGVSVGPDGGSHQALEDIALMRVLPNMIVVSPCDAIEAKKVVLELVKFNKPAYLRLTREETPVITTEETPFELGKGQVLTSSPAPLSYHPRPSGTPSYNKRGNTNDAIDALIIATGHLVHKAVLAARKLEKEKIKTAVINLSTIKPLDESLILEWAQKSRRVVTVEEHQIAGGMGSAVAELLARNFPLPIEFVGVDDRFGQSGTPEELLKHYGLETKNIVEAVKKIALRPHP